MEDVEKLDLPLDKREWHPSPLPGQIVLVTTVDGNGEANVAPKSWVAMAAFGPPPVLMFGCTRRHATARNAIDQGSFVVNVPGLDLGAAAWTIGTGSVSSGPERFEAAGLTPIPAKKVAAPRIAECRAHLECELDGIREWADEVAVFGRIVAVSVDADLVGEDTPNAHVALAPFFFLEDGWVAGLGAPRSMEVALPPRHVLTILATQDLAHSVAFYREAFGWPTRVEVDVYAEFALPDGRGLGLYDREGFARNTGAAPALPGADAIVGTEVYLHCDDLAASIERLEAMGARLLSARAPRDWGDEAAYYADPDGNVLVVAKPLDREADQP